MRAMREPGVDQRANCRACRLVPLTRRTRARAYITRAHGTRARTHAGTINRDVGSPGVVRAGDLQLIPGAAQALKLANDAGWAVCVVTNQSCVGKGLLSERELEEIHDRLRELLHEASGAHIDEVIFSTETAASATSRRKPSPRMLEEAITQFAIPRSRAVYVGDTHTDMLAARHAGVAGHLVTTGYGRAAGEAARAVGMELPCTADAAVPLGLPVEALPVRVHADLRACVESVLAAA